MNLKTVGTVCACGFCVVESVSFMTYGFGTRPNVDARQGSHTGEDGTYFIKNLYFDNYKDKAIRGN